MNLIIGSHVSFERSSQLVGCVNETLGYGANTFMIYTGAPQNTNRAEIDPSLVSAAHELMKTNGIDLNNIIVHAPYIINLGNNEKPDSYLFAINFLKMEIKRCEALGITKLVLHPGSSVNLSREVGINNIINALNEVLTSDQKVTILLETMAGKGSEIGTTFEELGLIMSQVKLNDKLGVCLDTCHLSDAGYDLSNFDNLLDHLEKVIGCNKIGCIHINDSKNINGAKKDRHENFGHGAIGFDQLIAIIYNPRLANVPKILETPYVSDLNGNDRVYPPYKFEIKMIKERIFDTNLIDEIRQYYR